ncbi:MAG: Na+/H+ antiporter subunit E [Acidimicrobiia bacterium]|jgi:monovalent cation/proton antiporter MnhG/PhaG subunit
MADLVGSIFIAVGATLGLLAAVGIHRFRTTLARLHAAAKPATLGLVLVVAGSAIVAGSDDLAGVALFVVALQFVTSPVAGHMLARITYLTGRAPGLQQDALATGDTRVPPARTFTGRVPVVLTFVSIVVAWMALWRDVSVGTVLAGLVVAAVVVFSGVVAAQVPVERVRPVSAVWFGFWYLWSLVKANALVAWEVVRPRSGIHEAIVSVEVESPQLVALIANAITFTPGTLTVEVGGPTGTTLFVHVLHFQDVESVRSSVEELERRAAAAFTGSRRAHG